MRVVSLRWLPGFLFLLTACGIDTSGGGEGLDVGGAGGVGPGGSSPGGAGGTKAGAGGVSGTAGVGGTSGTSGQSGAAGKGGAGQGGAGQAGVGGASTCGNGKKDAGEACDPSDATLNCTTAIGKPATGTATCNDTCTDLDTSGCHYCGDGHIDGDEQCDGADLGGKKCGADVGTADGGTLGCNAQCKLDTSQCTPAPDCGNGMIDADKGEECDGTLITVTCDQKHPNAGAQGTLGCVNCKLDDKCTFCGDGIKNNTEECDSQDLGGATCGGEQTGAPACTPSCSLDKGGCKDPTCSDIVKNQGESDTDCGGTKCPKCGNDRSCGGDGDCVSGYCKDGKCTAPTCNDGVKNGAETDKDCGATCGDPAKRCAQGLGCSGNGDCLSNVCTNSVCVGTCGDGVLDNSETDVDCGGPNCVRGCDDGKSCDTTTDCTSGNCAAGGKCATAKACTAGSQCTGTPCYGDYCLAVSNDDRLHASSCPAGWTQVGGSGCYLFVDKLATWYEAFRDCRDQGGNLAVLTSNARLDAVGKSQSGAKIGGNDQVWAGLACKNTGTSNNDCANKNSWTWLENTGADSGSWGTENPDKDSTCGYLRLRGSGTIGFGADDCAAKHTYLCERVQ